MPGRLIPIATNEIYHVFNRGVASQPIFFGKRDYDRAVESFLYYKNINLSLKYSRFLSLPIKERSELLEKLAKEKNFLVEIISYCFMPNHFHFLLRQIRDDGIAKFIGNFTNSYTRYLNTRLERAGPLFTGKFKAVRIETQEQLLHVSRYIHLNPYTSFVVKSIEGLKDYPHSSFPEYLNNAKSSFYNRNIIISEFKNFKSYKQFVFDQADYQRTLNNIKHLCFD
jgi:putative transposase